MMLYAGNKSELFFKTKLWKEGYIYVHVNLMNESLLSATNLRWGVFKESYLAQMETKTEARKGRARGDDNTGLSEE